MCNPPKIKGDAEENIWVYKRLQHTPSLPRGLLPSGALDAHPTNQQEYYSWKMGRQNIWVYTRKTFGYSLWGYSHREHWLCTRWQWTMLGKWSRISSTTLSTTIFNYIADKLTSITTIGSYSRLFEERTSQRFCTFQQSNKAWKRN
jgi:hypothetical protein